MVRAQIAWREIKDCQQNKSNTNTYAAIDIIMNVFASSMVYPGFYAWSRKSRINSLFVEHAASMY